MALDVMTMCALTSLTKPAQQHPGDSFAITFAPLSLEEVYSLADDPANGAAQYPHLDKRALLQKFVMDEVILLFSSALAAKEAAWMIRGEWDGCNGVFAFNPDKAAIRAAAAMLRTEFCYNGDLCHTQRSYEPQDLRRFEFSPVDFNPYGY